MQVALRAEWCCSSRSPSGKGSDEQRRQPYHTNNPAYSYLEQLTAGVVYLSLDL